MPPSSAVQLAPGCFPQGFLWGAGTSSYQIEGAATADGRSPSIWDAFCAKPGRVAGGQSGAVACGHYHRVEEDVALMKGLGLQAYRFSIAWPRVLPDGGGRVNEKGLDFYERLVDCLLEAGIKPWVTLYHWDLPQILEETGGWRNRETSFHFAELALATANRLGDRVASWATFNEPFCIAELGHLTGHHAPGIRGDRRMVNQVYHHLLLGHGLGYDAVKSAVPGSMVGFVQSLHPAEPLFHDEASIAAACELFRRYNAWLFDPLYHSRYPQDQWAAAEGDGTAPDIAPDDLDRIGGRMDFIGYNTYSSHYADHPEEGPIKTASFHPKTDMNWDINPDCLYWAGRFLSETYAPEQIYITESGCAYPDEVDEDGRVIDIARIVYLRQHLRGVSRAVSEGIPVKGYFVWSLLDNFEWAFGYAKRFGIVHVNFETLARTPKLSARWYREVIANNSCG